MTFTLNPVLQEHLLQLAKKISDIRPDDIPESLLECLTRKNGTETLQKLLHLLSPEFQKYVQCAYTQDWPFLPPTINPTMMAEPNPEIPKLNQVEILLLCLNSAFENEDYRMALTIAFVVDRFVYYCDGSAALLKIVDRIQKLSPSTPVAPQLVIRNARVMKDNGDLHGSIQILNSLIGQKWDDLINDNSRTRWQYKEEQQYINVSAVCVQIKGQIYHNLSLWKEAIGPLMESIEGFNRLRVKDYKGISYSYSLLSRCLCRLSKREYRNLRQEYSFQFDDHCYQAYEFGMMAYEKSPGQRLFFSKHLLQSGECLLMYTVQLADGKLRYEMFLKILEILDLVFYNQNPEELSQSKDQLFSFIKSLFVTCLTFGCSDNSFDRHMGNYLETICLFVYKKFCDIGANQLDSEIGREKLKKIIPALTFALTTTSQQHLNVSGMIPPCEGNEGVAKNLDETTGEHFHALTDGTKDRIGREHMQMNLFSADDNEEEILRKRVLERIDKFEVVGTAGEKGPMGDWKLATIGKIPADYEAYIQESVVAGDKVITLGYRKAVTKERVVMQDEGTPMVDCEAVTNERVVMQEEGTPMVDCEAVTKERVVMQKEGTPMVDCEAVTQERVVMQEEGTPMVDCEAVTKERVVMQEEGTPMVDCEAVTKERVVMQEEGTPMVDCEAVTQERVVMQEEGTPMVDCEAVTKERVVMQEEGTPMVDCEAVTKERVVMQEEGTPMVDCEAVTKERVVMQEEGTPMVDCEAVTKERVVMQEEGTPMVDCEAVTKERVVMQEVGTPMVDCEAVTKERVVMQEECTPMVDCEAVTKERVVMQEEGTPMVDCEAVTKERVVMQEEGTPMVDCEAVTKERVVMQEEGTPMVDYTAVTKERVESSGKKFPPIDCTADTQERNTDTSLNVMDNFIFDSGFSSMGSSFPGEFWNSPLKPRIVGLPSCMSMIESKVPGIDNLCQIFQDFIVDHDSSSMPRNKDASLVNTMALTAIRQSRKDGAYLANRLLTKFQRQESLPEEPQLNEPITEGMNQVSLSSFLGNLLRQHLNPSSSLLSKTDSRFPVFNWKVDPMNEGESISKVQKATLYEYNPVTCVWSGQDTIVCTGKELTLGKAKKGQFRNVYRINYLHQEEPLGKYVSKRYRNQREPLQYMDDVVCQMQAGLYVNLFNQALKMFELDLRIYFLNAAFMLLYDSQGEVEDWMNIEPFVDGEFIKLTNNYDFCEPRGKNVSTSFTHFTYVQSGCQMMVSDLQGWLPSGTQNLIYLTDPQFHTDSGDSSPFDFGKEGIKVFYDVVHPECNEICQTLKLERPTF